MQQPDPTNVYLDPRKLERERLNAGLARRKLAERLDLSYNTVDKAFRGEGVFPDVAKQLADYFGRLVCDLLSPGDPRYEPPLPAADAVGWEWQLDDGYSRSRIVRAANGLQYLLCRMRHRHQADRLGRGKLYLLGGLSAEERQRKRVQLERHPQVCERVGSHPHVAANLSAMPVGRDDAWWIVDRWVEGTRLSEHLAEGRIWPANRLPRLMREIALGLSALHAANVVLRELGPARVLISDADGRAVLTDFELAKLLDNAPTVRGEWPDDPYRAPEVDGGDVTPAADFYSWGRILMEAAYGSLPAAGQDTEIVPQLGLPKKVAALLQECLAPAREDRPQDAETVLKALATWK